MIRVDANSTADDLAQAITELQDRVLNLPDFEIIEIPRILYDSAVPMRVATRVRRPVAVVAQVWDLTAPSTRRYAVPRGFDVGVRGDGTTEVTIIGLGGTADGVTVRMHLVIIGARDL